MLNDRYIRYLLLLIFAWGIGFPMHADIPRYAYRIDYITTSDGLPQNTVDDILMDSHGFMWFATWSGLCRYDGYNFTTFRVGESGSGMPNHFVRCIAENDRKHLWVGTSGGVVIYDLNTSKFLPVKIRDFDLTTLSINDIYCENQRIWLATTNQGVIILDYKGEAEFAMVSHIQTSNFGIPSNTINVLFNIDKNRLLVGSQAGALLLDKNTNQEITGNNIRSLTDGSNVLSAYKAFDNTFWIGSQFSLMRANDNFELLETYNYNPYNFNSLMHNTVNAITNDAEGNILIGTLGGLCIYRKETNDFFRIYGNALDKTQLNSAFVNSIYCDSRGNIWIGTEKGGVNRYNIYQKPFGSYVHDPLNKNSLSHSTINSVFKDGNYLWVGTAGGGVNCIEIGSNKISSFRNEPGSINSISSNFITSIVKDQQNNLYFSTWGSGINRKKADQSNQFTRMWAGISGLLNNFVATMYLDPRGFFVVVTEGGIDLYDPRTDRFSHLSSMFPQSNLTETGCIELDQRGNYWIGSRNGLFTFPANKIDPGNITLNQQDIKVFRKTLSDTASIPGNYITTLRKDSKGQIWAGTYGNGICRIRFESEGNYSFQNYDQKQGLCNNVVYCIEEANDGTLWISTDNGLAAFDPATVRFRNYFERDGLQDNQFYWSASYKDDDGLLYFGGVNGLNYFSPQEMTETPYSNRVVFTDLKINNHVVYPGDVRHNKVVLEKPIYQSDKVVLSYKDNVFSIEFSALEYSLSDKISYSYQMEGVDNNWVIVGHDRRFASYTNLKGGEYLFKVRCSNNSGNWSDVITNLTINIVPPFWQTNWFRIVIMVFIMLLVMAYVRWSTFTLLEQKRNLEKQVKERTHKIEEQKEILQEQAENLKSTNLVLEQRNELIEGQKEELEKAYSEISAQRDQLIVLNNQVQLVNQLRLRFFTNISHEFRTPLTLIIDPIESLLERFKNDEKSTETLSTIHRNAKRLLHLINQLMYFRRVEMGKMSIRAEKANLVEFVGEIVSSFKDLSVHQNIEYTFRAASPETETWIDKEKIENVMYNLLSNAFKFTPKGGCIRVGLKFCMIEVDGKEHQGFELKVSDTGIGISKNNLEKVFDRFYQIDNPSNSSLKGSGIGLSLTRELVEAMHGKITVESEIGKGSEFIFQAPCSRAAFTDDEISIENTIAESELGEQISLLKEELRSTSNVEEGIVIDNSDRGKSMVLIVEDNFDLRSFLSHSLNAEYRVVEAANGKEGLELASRYTPDLIISDIMMPVMDGLEFCSRIKANVQTSHIPVILLTAKALTENWIEGLEIGADDYIPKPFNLKVLHARVKNLIDSRKKIMKIFSMELCPEVQKVTSNTLDEEFLQKTYSILDKHYVNPDFSVEDFAKEMCISKSLLYKKLKGLTGMSISDFMNSYKIKMSLPHLAEGRKNVADVAFLVGFNDPKYFSRVFRKFMGMSPTNFIEDEL